MGVSEHAQRYVTSQPNRMSVVLLGYPAKWGVSEHAQSYVV